MYCLRYESRLDSLEQKLGFDSS
eukprot:SAG25_NODE_12795_length_275_cov_0.590909_1_plen_22_part_01